MSLIFDEFAQIPIEKRKQGNRGNSRKQNYINIVTAFDIETSRLPGTDESFMYIWQWQFSDQYTVMGRTWTQLQQFIEGLREVIEENTLVVLVHNLSYEFQFLRTIYDFAPDEVFALDKRKVVKCTMYNKQLEFRCTYLHSNMSLAAYCKKMNVKHQKLDGQEFDYKVVRYPWTELTPRQIEYCQNDVLGLVEAYTKEMEMDNDNLESMPLTSTGYVRRDVKRAMRICGTKRVVDAQPNLTVYQLLKEAFRGGDTHANRFYVGKILENVSSADRSSSYPDVLVNCKFPVTAFRPVDASKDLVDLLREKRACLFRCRFTGIRLKDPYWGFPYLSRSKCRNPVKPMLDNGRILSADYLATTLTDIDWKIVKQQYTWKTIEIFDLHWARYGRLPEPLVLTCIEYYRDKTTLKGSESGSYDDMLYGKKKALLNSIYGCMAQDQCKEGVRFNGYDFEFEDVPITELLEKNSKRAYLCYAWGVWITAYARLRLQEGLQLAGDNGVYCDTDSVKYVGEIDWTAYNEKRVKASTRNGAYADDRHGERHYMGVFEFEGVYDKFVTLGAKKYATEEAGDIHITVSGVNKKEGAKELKAAGGLEAFREGMIFRAGGGTESVYNDDRVFHVKHIDGHDLEMGPNVCIKDSTYTLGITAEYMRLLQEPTNIF